MHVKRRHKPTHSAFAVSVGFFGLELLVSRLVAVRQATHAAHHAEHVVVDGVDADRGSVLVLDRVHGHSEVQRRLVDTREVAAAARLVLLRLQGKRVDVHADRRGAGVVLPRLDAVEVPALTLVEAVLAVELDLGHFNRVLALALHVGGQDHLREEVVRRRLEEHILTIVANTVTVELRARRQAAAADDAETRDERLTEGAGRTFVGTRCCRDSADCRCTGGAARQGAAAEDARHDTVRVPVIGVVERLLSEGLLDPRHNSARGGAVDERVALHNPDNLLHRVVEVHLDLVGGR